MSKSLDALKAAEQVGTITSLTSIFENIASMRIAKIKDKVTRSQVFFDELWDIYTSLRVDPKDHFTGKKGSNVIIWGNNNGDGSQSGAI